MIEFSHLFKMYGKCVFWLNCIMFLNFSFELLLKLVQNFSKSYETSMNTKSGQLSLGSQ